MHANKVPPDDFNYPHTYDPILMDQIWDIHNPHDVFDLVEDPIHENCLVIIDRVNVSEIEHTYASVMDRLKNCVNKKIIIMYHYKCLSTKRAAAGLSLDKHILVDLMGFEPKNIVYIVQLKADMKIITQTFGLETKVTYYDKWLEELHRYLMQRYFVVKRKHLERNPNLEDKLFSVFIRRYEDLRFQVMIDLLSKDLLSDSYYTFAAREGSMQHDISFTQMFEYVNNLPEIYIPHKNKILEWIKGIPYAVEKIDPIIGEGYNTLFTPNLGDYFNHSKIHLIVETHARNDSDTKSDFSIITEKTYKAIFYKKPFLLLSQPEALQALREGGYKTFSHVIDESYDNIENFDDRLNAISNEMIRIRNLDNNSLQKLLDACQDNIEHNYSLMLREATRKLPEKFNVKNFI